MPSSRCERMDLRYSDEDNEFRARARAWLQTHVPRSARPPRGPAAADFDRAWQRKLYEHGWAGVAWPTEYGGRGLSDLQQVTWYEELARAHAPHHINTTYVGLMHAGPTLIARGTEEQKAYHLPRILSGDALWCQGFSEPNAGSDLASLTTRGVVDDTEVVVTGVKPRPPDAPHVAFHTLFL